MHGADASDVTAQLAKILEAADPPESEDAVTEFLAKAGFVAPLRFFSSLYWGAWITRRSKQACSPWRCQVIRHKATRHEAHIAGQTRGRLIFEDAHALFAIWSDPEAMRYSAFPAMNGIEQATERIAGKMKLSAEGKDFICAIVSRATGEVIGNCMPFRAHEQCRRVEIGYGLQRGQCVVRIACKRSSPLIGCATSIPEHAMHEDGAERRPPERCVNA